MTQSEFSLEISLLNFHNFKVKRCNQLNIYPGAPDDMMIDFIFTPRQDRIRYNQLVCVCGQRATMFSV